MIPFNSDHMDFGVDFDEGFMLNTDRGMVIVGTDEDEEFINILVIHLGTGDRKMWKDFDDVVHTDEIMEWLNWKDKALKRKDKKLPPMCTFMKM